MASVESRASSERRRVLIVDDAPVVRQTVRRLIEATADLEVVDAVGDGRQALRSVARAALSQRPIQLVLLDIEMPNLDGLSALPELLAIEPRPNVVMLSGLTQRGAVASLKALAAGASDYICKPSAAVELGSAAFAQELIDKVRLWTARRPHANPQGASASAPSDQDGPASQAVPLGRLRGPVQSPQTCTHQARESVADVRYRNQPAPKNEAADHLATARRVRDRTGGRVSAIAVGGSTGGPQALVQIFTSLRGHILPPIFVTQHMPPNFTTILAEQLSAAIGRRCLEVVDDRPIEPGGIYLAAGDHHLVVRRESAQLLACASVEPPENFCRPAVDPMLRSIAASYGRHAIAVILTGMGQDGTKGSAAVRNAGGSILVQDEASSVVWGMPGSVARGGHADAVLPLSDIGPVLTTIVRGS